ncbi:MAG: flagellar biosynthetic protein FliR [Vampirovibrionales bacterium]
MWIPNSLMEWLQSPWLSFAVLLNTRISGFLITAPFFKNPGFNMRLKLFISVGLTLCFASVLPNTLPHAPTSPLAFALWALQELGIGLLLGFLSSLVLESLGVAGEVLAMLSGLSNAQIMDPTTGHNSQVITGCLMQLGLMIILCSNLHHSLLQILYLTFEQVPLQAWFSTGDLDDLFKRVLFLAGQLFSIGLLVAAPMHATLFLVEVCTAYISKTMPQMHIIQILTPMKTLSALGILLAFLPFAVDSMTHYWGIHLKHLTQVFK